ncbi:MAG: DUF4126 domain-containing protein [Gemmatimonadota bacterium]|jgi:hypothetical protein
MLELGTAAVLAGRLLGSAIACGLNLYATIALVGIASRFGFIHNLPPGLAGLESWIVIAGATVLFIAESVAAAMPGVDSAWEATHTLIRPLAAAALAGIALETAPWTTQIGAAALAGFAAFAAHSAKLGLRLVITTRRWLRVAVSTAEDIAAAFFAGAALAFPAVAIASVALFLFLLTVAGPTLWRAAAFAARASSARLRGFFGTRGWTEADALPPPLRALLDPPEIGPSPPRALRAALSGPAGAYRNGWLVFDRGYAIFLHRRLGRPARLDLPRPTSTHLRRGFLTDTLTMQSRQAGFTLHLLKDGPPTDLTISAFQLVLG